MSTTNETVSPLNAGIIKDNLVSGNVSVEIFDTVASTNSYAKEIAMEGLSNPTLICAEHQSAGRGRLGRNFYSPDSTGLYMSLAFSTNTRMADAVTITSAAAVAVCRAIESMCCIKCQIKWVNDIYYNGKKICGILTEAFAANDSNIIVVGIGVNCTTEVFPEDIAHIAGSIGKIDRNILAAKITDNLLFYAKELQCRSFMKEYRIRSIVMDKDITYYSNGAAHYAHVIDITDDGALLICENGENKTLSTGEITIRF